MVAPELVTDVTRTLVGSIQLGVRVRLKSSNPMYHGDVVLVNALMPNEYGPVTVGVKLLVTFVYVELEVVTVPVTNAEPKRVAPLDF